MVQKNNKQGGDTSIMGYNMYTHQLGGLGIIHLSTINLEL